MILSEPGTIVWRKSSYSGGNGECVEVGWRKSTYSGEAGGCVEVAAAASGVAVRDSKYRTGPTLSFPQGAWRAFVTMR